MGISLALFTRFYTHQSDTQTRVQAARYKRQGNSLCRMLGTPTPRPRSATRVKQQSVRQHKTKVPASGTLPRGPNSVGFRGKGGLKLGMIAKIRRSSKFVNQTCFTFCK